MVSGRGGILAMSGVWISLEAAHVFPLELESELGYSGTSNINSVQNGLLLKRDLHAAFDQYLLSINPDVCTPGEPISYLKGTDIR